MFPLVFANPWGLLGLLGIPVVLAIHLLHRHRRKVPISTLFLIEVAREPAQSGQRWHRLLPSVPMWLQLLLVLLLTALLSQPYLRQGVLRVAIVLDDSASMQVFRKELIGKLGALDEQTESGQVSTHWLVLSADSTRRRLYAGNEPQKWIATLSDWAPANGWSDPADALRTARDQVGAEGLVVYVTDTPRVELPHGAALLSVGYPLVNVGIGGVRVMEEEDGVAWQAVFVNPSNEPAEREWRLAWDGEKSTEPALVSVPAGGIATLEGRMPAQADRLVLALSPDGFALDDTFPFVQPRPKPLTLSVHGDGVSDWLPERMQRAIPSLSTASGASADFAVIAVSDAVVPPPSAGLLVTSTGNRDQAFFKQVPTAANHPLIRGLSWADLVARDVPAIASLPDDEVLLWVGDRPLLSLRQSRNADSSSLMPAPGPQLVFHFNPELSNFERLPAAAVLLLRFVESLREEKNATAWEQVEPGQTLRDLLPQESVRETQLQGLSMDGEATGQEIRGQVLRAPDQPGFFRVRDGESIPLEGAVAFADARESDFRDTAEADTVAAALASTSQESSSSGDLLRQLLSLLALVALLTLYHFSRVPTASVSSTM